MSKKSEEIMNVWRAPNHVELRNRTPEAKNFVTALFFREVYRSKASNDHHFETIVRHRKSILSPRSVEPRETEKETALQRLHKPS